jgi:deoxyhypusine synthase
MEKRDLLSEPIEHVDITSFDATPIVDMDFFEAIGFRHYRGSTSMADNKLRELCIDRIYDTFIDEEQLQVCDNTVKAIAGGLGRRPYSSREFIEEMGKYLVANAKKKDSLGQTAYEHGVLGAQTCAQQG